MDLITKLNFLRKKRGRKSKKDLELIQEITTQLQSQNIGLDIFKDNSKKETTLPKKRGRKPKGGKILKKNEIIEYTNNENKIPNILLHLKCKSKDLQDKIYGCESIKYNPNISKSIKPYNCYQGNILHSNGFKNMHNLQYNSIQGHTMNSDDIHSEYPSMNTTIDSMEIHVSNNDENYKTIKHSIFDETNTLKEATSQNSSTTSNIVFIQSKLDKLQKKLVFLNEIHDKSNCFWDHHSFKGQPIMIPKYKLNNKYYVYGSFCSPECASAYLFRENIDESLIWERYSLLYELYSPIYNYETNIKLSPDPYYLLECYYGNLSIEEYRTLIKSNKNITFIEKPMQKVFPELVMKNDDTVHYMKQTKYKLYRNKEPVNKSAVHTKIWQY